MLSKMKIGLTFSSTLRCQRKIRLTLHSKSNKLACVNSPEMLLTLFIQGLKQVIESFLALLGHK